MAVCSLRRDPCLRDKARRRRMAVRVCVPPPRTAPHAAGPCRDPGGCPKAAGAAQVATPRVRTAVKAEIPHVDDHVSKLQAVGVMTQNKLQDITAAAAAVGVFNIDVPHNCVTKGARPCAPRRASARRLPTARPGAANAGMIVQTQSPVLHPDMPHARLAEALATRAAKLVVTSTCPS